MNRDLEWLTPEICKNMIRAKGSAAAAARALGVSMTAISKRLNPLITKEIEPKSSPWGFDPTAKIIWRDPYPADELQTWIKGAQKGQKITVATVKWEKLPADVKKTLRAAVQEDKVRLAKTETCVKMKRN